MRNGFCLILLLIVACVAHTLPAQPANDAEFGSTVQVWSVHTTVRERVDGGPLERIELWSRTWVVSPSGRVFSNTNNYGLHGPDGSSTTTVTLNEVGRWAYWLTDGGGLDSFRFGDAPGGWSMWPHNPPNGVGYAGAGTMLGSYLDVQPGAPVNTAPTITWISGPSSVASGQNYNVSARGHDGDGNLAQVNVWKNGAPFAFAGGGNGTDGDSGNTTSDNGPTTITYTAQAVDAQGAASATISRTVNVSAPNRAPSINWTSAPSSVGSGQSYTITAHGNDADGNLVQVNVWKSGVPFAFAGGGNGTDGDSGNATSDTGPASITYTANAVDANGASSSTISHTVVVRAANAAPTITWTSAPGTVASGQAYTISARGNDGDGNLAQVNIWKNGVPFAFAGGGNGNSGDSSNPTSDNGPATVTYTANAVDSAGAASATISHSVVVSAPPSVTAAISTTPSSADAPGSTTVIWSSANASSVLVSGNGLSSTTANGSQVVSGLTVGTYSFTITAQGTGGPVTRTASFTVNAVSAVTASISASPTATTAPGTATISWSSSNATSVAVSGNGLNSSAANGSQLVTNLAAGTHTYSITAQGPNGPVTQTASVTVTSASLVSAAISASPTAVTAPGSSTLTWSSTNATAVSVSGPGLNSTAANDSRTVTGLSAGTYTYTISAQGPGGPVSRTATVTVNAAPSVSASLTTSPASGVAPASTTVGWNTSAASSVSVSGPGISSASANGSQLVSGLGVGTHTYTLVAQGSGGPVTRTATFTVTAAVPAVTASLDVSPVTGTAPASATLTWTSANASSVSITGPGVNSNASSGTQAVNGLPVGTHTFTLTAQGSGGPITRTATITVTAAGPNVAGSISISPATMMTGGTATLTWSTTNATSVRVSGFSLTGTPFETSPNLTINIGGLPPGTFTYTLVAQGAGGPFTRTATIVVNSADGLAASLTISPAIIYSNQSATMNWSTTGANYRWIRGYTPGMNGVSIYPAAVSGSTTLSGLSPGTYGYTIEYGPGTSATRQTFGYLTVLASDRLVATSVSPAGTGSVTGGGTFAEGTSATLNATPNPAYVFSHWSGDLTGSSNPLSFTIGGRDYAVVANFTPRTHTVAASVTPVGAGTVSGTGSFAAGSTATLGASADPSHAFTHWSGDLSSTANPLSFVVNGNVNLVANFATTSFALTTSATSGGSVTPGGTYPAGSTVAVSATPDSTSRFSGWSGDASGSLATTAITLDRAKHVQANFTGKTPQTILFDPPGDHALGDLPFTLTAVASSGLPVGFALLSGSAILTGNSLQLTGAGPVTVQATQPGDAVFLPAAPATQTFNVIAAAMVRYRGEARTLLRDQSVREVPPFVLQKP